MPVWTDSGLQWLTTPSGCINVFPLAQTLQPCLSPQSLATFKPFQTNCPQGSNLTSLTLWISSTLFNFIFFPPRVYCYSKCKPLSTGATASEQCKTHSSNIFMPSATHSTRWGVMGHFPDVVVRGVMQSGLNCWGAQNVSEYYWAVVEARDSEKSKLRTLTLLSYLSIK